MRIIWGIGAVPAAGLIALAACGGSSGSSSGFNNPDTLAQSIKQQVHKRDTGLVNEVVNVSCIATQQKGQFICQVIQGQNGVETSQQNVNVTVSPDGSHYATTP
jgi:hypothetical protein